MTVLLLKEVIKFGKKGKDIKTYCTNAMDG
jgi:hypothetical protein